MEVIASESDIGGVGFQPYVLDLAGLGIGDGDSHCVLAFAVMRRAGGVLLCLPEHPLSEEVLHAGSSAGPEDLDCV